MEPRSKGNPTERLESGIALLMSQIKARAMAFVTLEDQSLDTMPWEEGGFPRTRYPPLGRKHDSALRLPAVGWGGGWAAGP